MYPLSLISTVLPKSAKKATLGIRWLRAYELFSYCNYLLSSSDHRYFIVLAQGRTGSHLLSSLLRCHPSIKCVGEIFGRRNQSLPFSPDLFIKGLAAYGNKSVFGFHFKYYNLQDIAIQKRQTPATILDHYCKQDFKIIRLKRSNIFRQQISLSIAQQREIYQAYRPDDLRGQRYYIEIPSLINSLEKLEQEETLLDSFLHNKQYLSLNYERDLESSQQHQYTVNRTADFLGLPKIQKKVTTPHYPVTPRELTSIIENYYELYEHIAKTRFAHYLEMD